MSNKLIINDLECFRGEKLIFKRLSCNIESNQSMLIRGTNGSGKTSFLRTIAGYINKYNGSILFNDNDLQQEKSLLSNFQFIGQKNSLKENLTVLQNIEMWKLIYSSKKNINEILEQLDIRSLLNKDINSLSDCHYLILKSKIGPVLSSKATATMLVQRSQTCTRLPGHTRANS